jgi:hypothetical protein
MYELYTEECEKKAVEPLKEWMYRQTFTTKFNLSFHPPRKDTCKTCDILKIRIDATQDEWQKTTLKAELEVHHRKAEKIRESLGAESEKAKNDPTYDAITFDLEKRLAFRLGLFIANASCGRTTLEFTQCATMMLRCTRGMKQLPNEGQMKLGHACTSM